MKKPTVKADTSASNAKVEQASTDQVSKPAPKTPKPAQKPVTKDTAKADTSAASVASITERVGVTAGSIWHYLDQNGSCSVAKLIRELTEEEKIIQRSIGWLAQEGKISLETIDRVETIALK